MFRVHREESESFMVLEYASLGNLGVYLRSHTTLSDVSLLEMVYGVSQGMNHLQKHGIIHG